MVFAALMVAVSATSASAESAQSPSFQPQSSDCPFDHNYDYRAYHRKTIYFSCQEPGHILHVQCSKDPEIHYIQLIAKDRTGRYAAVFTCPGGPDNMAADYGVDGTNAPY
jgi:hypothetical protein